MNKAHNSTAKQPCLDNLKIVTVLHFYATGPGQELHQWLVRAKAAEATLIEHPFQFSHRTYARVERCRHGECVSDRRLRRGRIPLAMRYMLDLLRTVRIILLGRTSYDFYIGNGAVDTLPGILLRWCGKTKHVILYTIDYAPHAGGSRWYALVYRLVDKFCCYHADVIWVLSRRMIEAREADGTSRAKSAPCIWAPHGTHARELSGILSAKAYKTRVAFMGHIHEKSGIQLFLNIMPELSTRYPGIHLDIIGDGPFIPSLRKIAERQGLMRNVTFHGYLESHHEVERRLTQCGIGIALYCPELDSFTRYADPGKPKVYLACGLPVIITDVPEIADEIHTRGAGRKVAYEENELKAAFEEIIAGYDAFRGNARAMAMEYEWDLVFKRAFNDTWGRLSR